MSITDSRIEKYKEAFMNYHGRYPIVEKSGAWIYIDHNKTAFRSHQLVGMTSSLREMKRRDLCSQPTYKDLWFQPTYTTDNITLNSSYDNQWKEIGQDLINLFLQKIFNNCGNSLYDMEKCLKDYALSNISNEALGENKEKIDSLKRELRRKEKGFNTIIFMRDQKIKELEGKIENLRNNSVLFSMEDLEDWEDDKIGKPVYYKKYKTRKTKKR